MDSDRLKVYDAGTEHQLRMLFSDTRSGGLHTIFSRDGRTLLSSGDSFLCLWEVQTGRKRTVTIPFNDGGWQVHSFETGGLAVVSSWGTSILDTSTGRLLVAANRMGSVFDPTSSTLLFRGSGHVRSRPLFDSDIWSLSPIEGSPGVVRLWAELLARAEYSGGEQPEPLDEPSWQERRRKLEHAIEGVVVSEGVRRIAADRLYWLKCEARLSGRDQQAERRG